MRSTTQYLHSAAATRLFPTVFPEVQEYDWYCPPAHGMNLHGDGGSHRHNGGWLASDQTYLPIFGGKQFLFDREGAPIAGKIEIAADHAAWNDNRNRMGTAGEPRRRALYGVDQSDGEHRIQRVRSLSPIPSPDPLWPVPAESLSASSPKSLFRRFNARFDSETIRLSQRCGAHARETVDKGARSHRVRYFFSSQWTTLEASSGP